MPTKLELENMIAALRAEQKLLTEQSANRLHALNLLLNESVEWFLSHPTLSDRVHDFGIGVATNVPVEDRPGILEPMKEDVPIVFWRTKFPNGPRYITVYAMDDFQKLPEELARESESGIIEEQVLATRKARECLNDAYSGYMKRRMAREAS